MTRKAILTFLAVVCLSSLAIAKNDPKLSDSELAAITEHGRLLAGFDNAAWHASDAVQAMKPKDGLVKQYIARKTDAGWVVAFGRLNDAKDKFLVAFEAFEAGAPDRFDVKSYEPPREDEGFTLFAARAIETGLSEFRGANRPYNIAVLPAKDNGLFVYVYPAQVKQGVYPFGADARYLVSPDGLNVVETRQLHKTVIESIPSDTPRGAKVGAGYHTHVLTDTPEDTDVLLVLTRKPSVPEFVGAGKRVYSIETDGRIKIVK